MYNVKCAYNVWKKSKKIVTKLVELSLTQNKKYDNIKKITKKKKIKNGS